MLKVKCNHCGKTCHKDHDYLSEKKEDETNEGNDVDDTITLMISVIEFDETKVNNVSTHCTGAQGYALLPVPDTKKKMTTGVDKITN